MAEKQKLYGLLLVLAVAATPLVALIAPRFLAYWPAIIALPALLAYKPVFGGWPLLPKIPLLWAGLILLLAGVSSLWAIDPGFALERTAKTAPILLAGVALASVTMSAPLPVLMPWLRLIPIVMAVAAVMLTFDMLANFPLYRLIHGIGAQGHVEAAGLNRGVIGVLGLAFIGAGIAGKVMSKAASAELLALFGVMLLFTTSQSAQFGFILALLCYVAFPYRRKIVWQAFACILGAGVLAAPFLAHWLFTSFAAQVMDMPFLGHGGGFGAQRLEIWDSVGRYALQQPLHGYGIEATRAVDSFDTQQIYRKSDTELHPHNFAIQVWIEFGLLGAILAAAFLAHLVRGISRLNWPQARIALPGFMVLLAVASFGYGLWQSWFIGLFVLVFAFTKLAVRLHEEA